MQISIQALRDAVGITAILGHNDALDVTLSRGLTPLEGTLSIAGVRTDSRQVEAGDMFVCIVGDRFDGHDFAADVVARGATVLLAERDPFAEVAKMEARPDVVVLIVANAVLALGKLANWYRNQTKAKVIGITGTAGKTTVKELLAHVLSTCGTVAKNPLNLNNQIGLPLSMLAATGEENFWVMEAGISEARDMDELGAILRPDFALILNVGQGHTLGLGQRGVAHYKSLLLKYLMDKTTESGVEKGQALVSADYDDLVREARSQCRNITFFSATGKPMTYRAAYMGVAESVEDSHIDAHADVMHGRYRVWLDGVAQEIVAPFRGAFGAENVIAVAAMAHMLGVSGEDIAKAFTTATLPKQRFACKRIGSCTIIDDTYNANPLSMKCMVEAVVEMKVGAANKKGANSSSLTFVLGEMLELGSEAERAHQDLGRLLASTGASAIYWKGGNAEAVDFGLRRAGYSGHFAVVNDAAHCLELMAEHGMPHGYILFKGSRGNRLELFREVFETALFTDICETGEIE